MRRTHILTALMVLALLPVLSTCGGNTDTWEVSTIMEPTENSQPELVLHTQIADLSQTQADCTLTVHEIIYTTAGARLRISIDNQASGRAVIVTTTSTAQQNGEMRRALRIYAGGDERGSAFLSAEPGEGAEGVLVFEALEIGGCALSITGQVNHRIVRYQIEIPAGEPEGTAGAEEPQA